jgi:TatD DNase family protein
MTHAPQSLPPLVDSHCHLPMVGEDASAGWAAVERARAAGVGTMLHISVDFEGLPDVLAFAEGDPHIYASVGVHPNNHPGHVQASEDIARHAEHEKVLAIGETGLDYFRTEGDISWQHERFRNHIRAARALGKPLVIHTREAREDTIRLLREENAREVGGVMHCFVEDYDTALAAIDMGFLISLSGIVTFRNASELQAVAKALPLESLLVETDSPYLAPVPKRGKPNEPAYVSHVAAFLATLRDEPLERIHAVTTANFHRLFGGQEYPAG